MATGDLIQSLRANGRQALGDILLNLRKIDQQQLAAALEEQKQLNQKLGDVLVAKGVITAEELKLALAVQNGQDSNAPILARKQLGDLLLENGKITSAQLEAALEAQELSQKRIGEVLVELGFVSARDIETTLQLQDSIAFSSRRKILDSLSSQAPARAAELPAELARNFPTRTSFLDVAAKYAFTQAFGRSPTEAELRDARPRLATLAGEAQRQAAYQKVATYFQNIVADRISQLVGADAQKRFDRLGNVVIEGLRSEDLALAKELATAANFKLADAARTFVENSPNAFFRSMVGRAPTAIEEELFAPELKGPNSAVWKEALREFHAKLLEWLKPYSSIKLDPRLRAEFIPGEDELKRLAAAIKARQDLQAYYDWLHNEWFYIKSLSAHEAERTHKQELKKLKLAKLLAKVREMLFQILGQVPPKLMAKIEAMISAALASGADPDTIESKLTDLLEKILALFAKLKGAAPSGEDLSAVLDAALDMVQSGGGDINLQGLEQKLAPVIEQLGKPGANGLTLKQAIGLVNQMNHDYKGEWDKSAGPEDPWVTALMDGSQSPASMRASFEQYYKTEQSGIPQQQALDFVAYLNRAFRGVDLAPDPNDPWVEVLASGAMTPGEAEKEWKSQIAPEAAAAS